jgi:hypothetical protein
MLKSVHIKNFKLHEDTLIEAAPITVFIGPNNSGKSSIFQILLCLRDAAARGEAQLLVPGAGQVLDAGDFANVVRLGQKEVEVSLSGVVDPADSSKGKPRTEVSFELRVRDNALSYNHGMLVNEYGKLEWAWNQGIQIPPPQELVMDGFRMRFAPTALFGLLDAAGHPVPPRAPWPGAQEDARERQELHKYIANAPVFLLKSLHPIFPLRGFEQQGYGLPEKKPETLEFINLNERAASIAGLLAYDRDLEERLSQRLAELVSIRIKVRLVAGRRATIWAEPTGAKRGDMLFVNEGTGANQLPFMLIPVALTPPNETILLSEPEAHLHPKGQCDLTRMLLTVAKRENIQFFIETHSEHVLHVILNAIAKHEWDPSQVAIYSFVNVDGTANATRLEVDEQGGVKGGLPGFFDQSLDELTEYLEALKKPTV